MDSSYQFYYFVPLSTFWFLMVTGTMWFLQRLPAHMSDLKSFGTKIIIEKTHLCSIPSSAMDGWLRYIVITLEFIKMLTDCRILDCVGVAVCCIVLYIIAIYSCSEKRQHKEVEDVIQTIFAELGKISLELFLCQYHLWLASDTKSLLLIEPGNRILNAIICTIIFVTASHAISSSFGVIVSWMLPKELSCVHLHVRFLIFLGALYIVSLLVLQP
eukprot:gene1704-4828_t